MNNEKYKCPECQSDSIRFKFKVKNHNNYSYANVTEEIQCAGCFMDIPSNLCENINFHKINDVKKLWIEDYKPIHINEAAKCSKCLRKYWDIEKYLFLNNQSTKDIFYQIFSSNKEIGDLICKICDPNAFK